MTWVLWWSTLVQKLIDSKKRKLKITQPVLVQSLQDEFDFKNPNNCPETPAPASTHLMASGQPLSPEKTDKISQWCWEIAVFNKMVMT